MMDWWFIVVVYALLSCVAVALYCRLAQRWPLWDMPAIDRAHAKPTLRGGGMVFVVMTLLVAMLFIREHSHSYWPVVFYGGGVLAIVGFIDDLRGLSPLLRLLTQIVVASVTVVWLSPPPLVLFGDVSFGTLPTLVLWCLIIVSFVNWFNFIDGMNGLATMQALFVLVCGSLTIPSLWPLTLIVSGGLLGFLYWNLRGRVFMGDVGSYFLGFVLIVASLWSTTTVAADLSTGMAVFWWILAGFVVVDPLLTILARLRYGVRRLCERHHQHTYQRLMARVGMWPVLIGVCVLNVVWLWPMAWLALDSRIPMAWLALAYTPLVVIWYVGRRWV